MTIENVMSMGLKIGVTISVLLIMFGVVLLFSESSSGSLSINTIALSNSSVNSASFSLGSVIKDTMRLQGLGFIFLGLAVLIATPVVRVILSILFFVEEENWLYVFITILVLFNLLFAILIVPSLISTKVVVPS
jgi:uncharacterized membrane protein